MSRKTRITRRTFSTSALAAAAALGMPRVARAQAYPSRPVRLILPFGAGGVADATSRLAADKLGDILKQRFVVENMPGPGGMAAARAMITAAPDGYTLGLITNGTAISQAIYKQYPVRPGEGPRADLRARQFRAGVRDRRGLALQDDGRSAQGGARAARQAQPGHHRRRQHPASRRRAPSLARQDQPPARSLQDHAGCDHRDHSRRYPVDDRFLCGDERGPRRQEAASARHLRHQALGLPAGRADGRRGGRARLRGAVLERPRRSRRAPRSRSSTRSTRRSARCWPCRT